MFFALWPDEALRDRFDAVAAPLRAAGRVTARANWHLTLVFLGGVDAAQRAGLESAVQRLRPRRFTLRLDRVRHWRRSHIVWLGGAAPPGLVQLVSLLRAAARAEGIEDPAQPYRAHVTLARGVVAMPQLQRINRVDWAPMSFVLVESRSTGEGIRYAPLRAWPLSP